MKNKVSHIIQRRNDFEDYIGGKEIDTLTINSSFDSLFVSKSLGKGVKVDSSGNIIESIQYKNLGKSLGGPCIYSETQAEYIYRFKYNKNGKIVEMVTYNAENLIISTHITTYDSKGLLYSEYYKNHHNVTLFKYETN